jgi:hypothetical protein
MINESRAPSVVKLFGRVFGIPLHYFHELGVFLVASEVLGGKTPGNVG